jgi:high-affinity iron transporter
LSAQAAPRSQLKRCSHRCGSRPLPEVAPHSFNRYAKGLVMFQILLVSFREGLEAFLIVAIAAIYLRRTGREVLLSALRVGTSAAVVLSVVLGLVLARVGALSSAWSGVMALVAAAAVITCTVHMMRMGRHMKGEITAKLGDATLQVGPRAWWGVALFALLMVGREGIETATILASLAGNSELRHLAVGGLIGVLLAATIAWSWVRNGHKVNLGRFFQVTAVFMIVFSVQLVIYAFHEFTEAGLVPGIDNARWHLATEDLAEGAIAQAISIGLVLLPVVWLAAAHWFARPVPARQPG